jgi:hypothetical protein
VTSSRLSTHQVPININDITTVYRLMTLLQSSIKFLRNFLRIQQVTIRLFSKLQYAFLAAIFPTFFAVASFDSPFFCGEEEEEYQRKISVVRVLNFECVLIFLAAFFENFVIRLLLNTAAIWIRYLTALLQSM